MTANESFSLGFQSSSVLARLVLSVSATTNVMGVASGAQHGHDADLALRILAPRPILAVKERLLVAGYGGLDTARYDHLPDSKGEQCDHQDQRDGETKQQREQLHSCATSDA